jgi:catechol 2,3-dioxygenase-like lactoylglutathione lyase family enzyme
VHVRVAETGHDAATAEVDAIRRSERGFVRSDPACDPLACDRDGPRDGNRRVHRPDRPVLEDHNSKNVTVLDHVTLNVADVEAAKAFYAQALAPLGYELTMDFVEGAGYAAEGKPDFFLAQRGEPSSPVHVAFRAPDRRSVDAFHEAAIAAGGTDNGPPGIRRVYHEYYYGAYALDPEGNNIEAVTHEPE